MLPKALPASAHKPPRCIVVMQMVEMMLEVGERHGFILKPFKSSVAAKAKATLLSVNQVFRLLSLSDLSSAINTVLLGL